jgi:hypothetical protein
MPIALSTVEGCAQSPRRDWSTGVIKWWNDGSDPNTPLLQHSISFGRLASEVFLSSLKSEFFSNLLVSVQPTFHVLHAKPWAQDSRFAQVKFCLDANISTVG